MQSNITYKNCKKPGHLDTNCYAKGGRKESQALWIKKSDKKPEAVVVAADDKEGALNAFTCTSNYAAMAQILDVSKSRLETCMDSGASKDYWPDCTKFTNYKSVQRNITTANERTLNATGIGDLYLDLPNRSEKTSIVFKNAVHAPDMAFMLISISCLNKAGFSVTLNKGMCMVKDSKAKTIATIPHSNELYKTAAQMSRNTTKTTNTTSAKMSISKAHHKLGHIAHSTIQHTVSNGFIIGVDLHNKSKPEFCEACAKAKLQH